MGAKYEVIDRRYSKTLQHPVDFLLLLNSEYITISEKIDSYAKCKQRKPQRISEEMSPEMWEHICERLPP